MAAYRNQQVLATLRSMIITGELAPGEPLAEIPLSKRLGVSRTPVRMAIRLLAQEGLVEDPGNRRYVVREISPRDIHDAIEVRGVLEGLAARLVAENGLRPAVRRTLVKCLAEGDHMFGEHAFSIDDLNAYHDVNRRFHDTIVGASQNRAIHEALSRNDHLPFASANSIVVDRNAMPQEQQRFQFAHMQHHLIFEALDAGQSGRAEDLMREHANVGLKYSKLFSEKSDSTSLRVIVGNTTIQAM